MSNIVFGKSYPKLNNNDILEFQVCESKFQVVLSSVYLHFVVEIPQDQIENASLIPQNWFGAKQFSSVEVKLNDESVTRRSMANEYALSAYINSLLSYSKGTMQTGLKTLGIFDEINLQTTQIAAMIRNHTWDTYLRRRKAVNNTFKYEIIMPIDNTIFYSDDLLPSGQRWSLSFERAETQYSTLLTVAGTVTSKVDKVLALEDVYLMIPYVNDEKTNQLESNWIEKPISIGYDNYQMQRFTLESGTANIRLSNIINGKLPKLLLYGIMEESAYMGSFTECSTKFGKHNLTEIDMLLNGVSVQGMPIKMSNDCVAIPYTRFLSAISSFMDKSTSQTIPLQDFHDYHFLHVATFPETAGALSFELSFSANVASGLILVTCSIFDVNMEIDKYGNFKIN